MQNNNILRGLKLVFKNGFLFTCHHILFSPLLTIDPFTLIVFLKFLSDRAIENSNILGSINFNLY